MRYTILPREKKPKKSVLWKLFGMMVIFIAIVISIVSIFQVLLLDTFYESSKVQELEVMAGAISSVCDDISMLENVAYDYAIKYSTCVRVFKWTNNDTDEIASVKMIGYCKIHHLSNESIEKLYENAKYHGGTFTTKEYRSANAAEGVEGSEVDEGQMSESPIGMIYVRIAYDGEGNEYAIMLNSKLTPLAATVTTLRKQLVWIVILLLIVAMGFAVIMTKGITEPLIKINESAKKLAKGQYDTSFDGGEYLEIKELSDTLNYAAGELSKTSRLQKELIANISHDLRTPLTMINGYSEMMRDIPSENTPENMQVIIDETARLTELVNDLLDISKIHAGTQTIEKRSINITQIVRGTMARYAKLTEHDGYSIKFDDDGDAYVSGDITMLLQVIYNLINNAINYTGPDKNVLVVQTRHNGRVKISVSDTGEGISPEDLPHIWDRYYKVDKVHKRARVGTGLGLSIVKGCLELHGATYGVDSVLKEGSTFWFELPEDIR